MKTRRGVRAALLRWYDESKRDLPWRHTRDPYKIWISEAMLQQTRVDTVIPYYERFLEKFPDLGSLARADTDDVLALWAGLGYYSRARNLKRGAEFVMDNFGGKLPDDADQLQTLPGIGRYTAGAIASIAFDREAPIVDGNVARVLSRLYGWREDPKIKAASQRLWEEAAAMARGPRPGDLNQALMELGATLCTPRSPRCGDCPVMRACVAHANGNPEAIPARTQKAAVPKVEAVAALVSRREKALLVRRPAGGLLGGLWELPGGALRSGERPREALDRHLAKRVGLATNRTRRLGAIDHLFSHRALHLHVYHCDAPPGSRVRLRNLEAHRWVNTAQLEEVGAGDGLGMATLTRKALSLF